MKRGAALAVMLACGCALAPAAAVTVSVHDHDAPLAGVVVALDPLDGAAPPASAAHAAIDQVAKRFVPRVSVVRTGTSVDFPNSDQIRHQVYSFSPAKKFTLKLYAGRTAPPVLFDHPGLVVLGCNIHDTMVAFVAVVDTPYFGLTDAEGHVGVNVPPGRYRLRAWHPDLQQPVAPQTVTVAADGRALEVEAIRAPSPADVTPWPD